MVFLKRFDSGSESDMANVVYALCAATSLVCFGLLVRRYRATGFPLLLWSSFAFLCFTLGNALLFVDKVVTPEGPDLMLYRTLINLFGVVLLLYRLIWDTTRHRR